MRWGLAPSWWKDAAKLPAATFNARTETLAEKPTFRNAFKRRRCIIPVDGFYEWMAVQGKPKQPFYLHPKDQEGLFVLAGLWDYWETQDGAMESCTIITTEPNELMVEIHNRMPVILQESDFDAWLDLENQTGAGLHKFLVPCDPAGIEAYRVGLVRSEGKELIQPIGVDTPLPGN
jgi:putative SOS response-associated peptidase YedK